MYFNLIIRPDESQTVPDIHMFRQTAPEVKWLFEQNGKPDLRALCDLPTIMVKQFGPDTGKQTARIGYIDSPSMRPTMKNPIFYFPSDLLIERQILGDETYTPNQLKWVGKDTRWTVFEGDPFRTLFADGQLKPENLDRSLAIDETLVAVMMPFNDDHSVDPVYRAIREGVGAAGKSAKRVDEIMTATKIPDDVKQLIRTSSAVVIDLTGLNLNVVYELGFADGLGKKAILIKEGKVAGLPFDFAASRVFAYERNQVGLQDLSERLKQVIQS